MGLMSKINNHASQALIIGAICFLVLVLAACGKKGDLYLPEEKAKVTSSAEQKKDKKKTQE
jgi:predicted small lipoprotein YifL